MGETQSCLACDSKRAGANREVRQAIPNTHISGRWYESTVVYKSFSPCFRIRAQHKPWGCLQKRITQMRKEARRWTRTIKYTNWERAAGLSRIFHVVLWTSSTRPGSGRFGEVCVRGLCGGLSLTPSIAPSLSLCCAEMMWSPHPPHVQSTAPGQLPLVQVFLRYHHVTPRLVNVLSPTNLPYSVCVNAICLPYYLLYAEPKESIAPYTLTSRRNFSDIIRRCVGDAVLTVASPPSNSFLSMWLLTTVWVDGFV